jgi:hypothetical protein
MTLFVTHGLGVQLMSKSNGMDAPALYGISCAKVEVSSNHFNQQERPCHYLLQRMYGEA